jgi:uncharacterized protein YihD (DUF1040 family)
MSLSSDTGVRDAWHINETIDALREAWLANPELRLTQLVENAARVTQVADPFYCEDDVLAASLRSMK